MFTFGILGYQWTGEVVTGKVVLTPPDDIGNWKVGSWGGYLQIERNEPPEDLTFRDAGPAELPPKGGA
jgi:hypothetical protein